MGHEFHCSNAFTSIRSEGTHDSTDGHRGFDAAGADAWPRGGRYRHSRHGPRGGEGFEVEFVTLLGETVAVVTVPADAVRSLREREIAHARILAG